MKNLKPEFRNGILLFLAIGLFFIIMNLLGFADNIYLRTVNIFFVFYFVNRSIVEYKQKGQNNYMSNFGAAFLTAIIGVISSIGGFILYVLLVLGVDNLSELAEPLISTGQNLSLLQYSFVLFAEGIASSIIVSFILMQYHKDSSNVNN